MLVALMACAAAGSAAFAENAGAKKAGPVWWYRAQAAFQQAEKVKKPVLLTLALSGDLGSWELRQRVFATEEFRAVADKFVLCQDEANSEYVQALKIDVTPADIGAIIFLTPQKKELERVRFNGDPALTLSVIKRVAAGNSIAALREKVAADAKNAEALNTLYSAYVERREAPEAVETLGQLKSAAPDSAKKYDALITFWGVTLLQDKGQDAEALADIERILPGMTEAAMRDELVVRRLLMNSAKDGDAAIADLRKFIAGNAGSPVIDKAYAALFNVLAQAGKNGDAIAVLQQALQARPDNRFAIERILNVAMNLYNAGQYEPSRKLFETIAGKVRGMAACEQADIMYRAMANGVEWKKRLAPARKVLDVMYVVPDTATFLYYISLWDAETYFPVLVNSGSVQDRRLIQRFAAMFNPSRIIIAPARKDIKVDEATVMRAVLASWNKNDLDSQAQATQDDIKKELKKLGLAPMGIVFADTANEGLLAGGAALAAGRFELPDFFHAADATSKVTDSAGAKQLRARIAEKIEKWGYEYKHPFDDLDFVTFACEMPMKFQGDDWPEYNVDDFVTRRDDDVRFAYPGRLMEGTTRADYMAMCALFLQPSRALFFNTYKLERAGFAEYKTAGAAADMKPFMPADNMDGRDANIKKWRELMGRVNPYGYLHVNASGGKDTWWVETAGIATQEKLDEMPSESVPCVVEMTHSYSADSPWDFKTIAGRWLNAGAYIYFGSNYEPFLQSFRTPERIMAAIKEGEPLGAAYRAGFGEKFWIPWRLCYMGDPMFVLTGKRAPKEKADGVALRKDERQVKEIKDVFEKQD